LGKDIIRNAREAKYLGVEFDGKLSWKSFKSRVLLKARSTMALACSMGVTDGSLSVPAMINLWTALVRSQVEYACEIWGNEEWPEGELLQNEMARRILKCGPKTPIGAMLGDLGWWSLRARRDQRRLLYWGNLVRMDSGRQEGLQPPQEAVFILSFPSQLVYVHREAVVFSRAGRVLAD
jgi:hypothetical protein